MQAITGNFAIHRTKTPDGKNAILLVPEAVDISLQYSMDEEHETSMAISFETVTGGESAPDSYITLRCHGSDDATHLGPYCGGYKQ